ncbi:MAG: hypothetical protein F9K40_07420 [Kofleriaceae bacterium]|nr:MAG: hypothetical protein F9K40_07420 [Kofleriaceae bacterium]
MKRIALSVVALAFLTAPALAQTTPAPRPKKVKTITIEAIEVDGDRVTRPLEPISVNEAAKSSSLIRIRRDFIDLILKTANEV